jgi:hypothetical protein
MRKRSEVGGAEERANPKYEAGMDTHQEDARGPNPGLGPTLDPPEPGAVVFGDRTFRAVWGEEKITPVPGSYSTVTVGPFESLFVVAAGGDAARALDHANRELAAFAEVERERKVQSFLNKTRQVTAGAKGDR